MKMRMLNKITFKALIAMNKIISFLFVLLTSLSLQAQQKAEFFARILPDREQIYAGDSMLVSVVLYSTYPIAKAECSTDFNVKGKCSLRKLNIDRNATAGRTREGQNVYYTLVWNQYVIAPEKVGTYTIPAQKFKATLQQIVRMPDMFDQMMGARPEYRNIKVQGEAPTFKFEATEKPLRSTQEMMRNRGRVL